MFFKAWINQPGVLTLQSGGKGATCNLFFVSHSAQDPLLTGHTSHSSVFLGRTNCQPFTAGMGAGLEEWILVLLSPGTPLAFPVIIPHCSCCFPSHELLQPLAWARDSLAALGGAERDLRLHILNWLPRSAWNLHVGYSAFWIYSTRDSFQLQREVKGPG